MQAKNTFSILFWINKSKIRNNEAPIWARVTVDGVRVEISIKKSIHPENWNSEKGQAKGSKEESRSINNYIEFSNPPLRTNKSSILSSLVD